MVYISPERHDFTSDFDPVAAAQASGRKDAGIRDLNFDVNEVSSLRNQHINAKDNLGRTTLHRASENRREAIVQELLRKGAYVNAKDNERRTPLYMVACNGHEAVMRLLLEKGADVNAKDKWGRTALYMAACN